MKPKPNLTTSLLSTFWNGATVHIDISSRVDSLQALKRHWISRESFFLCSPAAGLGSWNLELVRCGPRRHLVLPSGGEQYVLACELQVIMSSMSCPSYSSVMLFRQQEASANWQTMMSDSGVWVDPTLLRKRLICWDRPDFFNLGTPPMRSTAGYPFSSDCFPPSYVSGKTRGEMFQLKETCPRFSRESRFTQGHFMCLFKTRKSPVLPFQSRLSPGSGRSQFHGPHGSAGPKVSGHQPASWWGAQDPPRQQARHDRRSDLLHSEAPPHNGRCQIMPPGPSAVGGGLNFRLASQTRA